MSSIGAQVFRVVFIVQLKKKNNTHMCENGIVSKFRILNRDKVVFEVQYRGNYSKTVFVFVLQIANSFETKSTGVIDTILFWT